MMNFQDFLLDCLSLNYVYLPMIIPISSIEYDWGEPQLPDRNGYKRLDALDPREDMKGGAWNVFLPLALWDNCKGMPYRAHELAVCVRMILARPGCVFLGFRDKDSFVDEEPEPKYLNGFVYAGVPAVRYHHQVGRPGEPNSYKEERPPTKILCVFVTAERVITSWNWYECVIDPDGDEFPIHHDTRFGRRIK